MTSQASILAFDIGGTKTASAVGFVFDGKVSALSHEQTWHSRDFEDFASIASQWLSSPAILAKPVAVAIGIAGPVSGVFPRQSGFATNLGWTLEAEELERSFGNIPVFLCNDMESHGWGLLGLAEPHKLSLNSTPVRPGCKALIAAGTGLGESIIAWDGRRHIPLGGEGGHAAFSPSTERDDQLLQFLRRKHDGHVSWERVLGGFDGFRNLAEFLAGERGLPEAVRQHIGAQADWGASIVSLAQQGNAFCEEVISYFSELYGREASNLAVKCMPYSGLYLGGGIAPRIVPWLKTHFLRAFQDKGRFRTHLEQLPVWVIQDPANGLKGAAIGAWHQLRTR